MRLHPTRGLYDLTGVQGAAGPIQLCGMVAAGACIAVGALTFQHTPFTVWAFSALLLSHGLALALRRGQPSLNTRLAAGLALATTFGLMTLLTPSLRGAAMTPDMQADSDYLLGGVMIWITLIAQCFAAAPGVLLFALVPELAALAVFGQMNVGPDMPACYCVYLGAALGLLSYASFLRRPHGAPPPRRRVIPAPGEMVFGVAVLFATLAAGGLVLAVVLRILLPAPFNSQWWQRRVLAGAGAAQTPYQDFGTTLSLRHNSGPLDADPVLRVQASQPVLLRRKVYSRYTGDGWIPRVRTSHMTSVPQSGEVPALAVDGVPRDGERVDCIVEPVRQIGSPLPVPGSPTMVRGLSDRFPMVTYYGTVEFQGHLEAGEKVWLTSVDRTAESGGLENSGADYDDGLIDEGYLDVAPGVEPIRELALGLTGDQPSVSAKVDALERYVEQTCAYNLAAPPPAANADSVVDFLTRRKQGTCVDFASALAILCRLNGIPSRLVTGYAATDPDPDDVNLYLVRERNAHAWVEVYYAGVGWVTHDPQADREIRGGAFASAVLRMRNGLRSALVWLRQYTVLLVGAIPVAYILLYEVRRRGTRLRTNPRRTAGHALRRVLTALEPWAAWAMPGRTPRETVEAALGHLPEDLHAPVTECVDGLMELRYSAREPEDTRLARAVRQAKSLRRQLRRTRGCRAAG